MNRTSTAVTLMLCSMALATGCAKKQEEQKKGPPPALITVAKAESRNVAVLQESVGVVESLGAPTISAEVRGRIIEIAAEVGQAVKAGQTLAVLDGADSASTLQAARAEVKRTEALFANQQRLSDRYRELSKQNFISPLKLEETESQLTALREQLNVARAQEANAARNVSRNRIIAPVSGRIEQRLVAKGDYVDIGKPLFQIATAEKLRIRLPFPEGTAGQIKPGMAVRLSSPAAPAKPVEGKVSEVKPMVGTSNRSFDAIVEIANPGDWKPGASVNGAVVVEEHPNTVAVPDTSVVLRPAGKVVYIIKDMHAIQAVVQTGARQEGFIEILSGLNVGETVALDGAGYLTDKVAVAIQGGKK